MACKFEPAIRGAWLLPTDTDASEPEEAEAEAAEAVLEPSTEDTIAKGLAVELTAEGEALLDHSADEDEDDDEGGGLHVDVEDEAGGLQVDDGDG